MYEVEGLDEFLKALHEVCDEAKRQRELEKQIDLWFLALIKAIWREIKECINEFDLCFLISAKINDFSRIEIDNRGVEIIIDYKIAEKKIKEDMWWKWGGNTLSRLYVLRDFVLNIDNIIVELRSKLEDKRKLRRKLEEIFKMIKDATAFLIVADELAK